VLVCELIASPYANMGVCDDGPYILMARTLATTGHILYNGWGAPMLGWQLYLGAAFIKLFGFSFTAVRSCTVLVAMALAFLLQRTLVRANITERNATIGTLAMVLSPLYLMLSVTFMTDIFGLFAIILCLYGCLRALQASTSRATIGWLCFAVATNAICGTSRQIAWLGILVMAPSALWLLRAQRRVLIAGAAANIIGAIFIFACMQWLKHQPYSVPEHLLPSTFPLAYTLGQLSYFFLDIPFLLLPIVALFLPQMRKYRPLVFAIVSALFVGYLVIALQPQHRHGFFMLEPTQGDWVTVYGFLMCMSHGGYPIFLHTSVRALLTIASFGGLLGVIAVLLGRHLTSHSKEPSPGVTWKQLAVLLAPFAIANMLLLVPRAASSGLFDRYTLELLVVALLCLVRCYQEQIQPQLPLASFLLVGIMAIYGIAVTHNMFSFYRTRVALAAELRSNGVPDTSVDNGWEYNLVVELQHADFINEPTIAVPAHAYVPTPPPPADACPIFKYDETPHIHPLYGISFDPNACYGLAPFTPMHYTRWLASGPGTLYVVRYTTASAR
jgi:hypothetical protein